jgi:hypothetical protein
VLCAYLRLPYDPNPGDEPAEGQDPVEHARARAVYRVIREVRHTIIRIIAHRLRDGATVSWQGPQLDFTDVIFDGGDFQDAVFGGRCPSSVRGSLAVWLTSGPSGFWAAWSTSGPPGSREARSTSKSRLGSARTGCRMASPRVCRKTMVSNPRRPRGQLTAANCADRTGRPDGCELARDQGARRYGGPDR